MSVDLGTGLSMESKSRFQLKLFLSYFLFAILLSIILTFIHIYFSQKHNKERFELRSKEMLVGKINLMKDFVASGSNPNRIGWLMEHLHSSELFSAKCVDKKMEAILQKRADGLHWRDYQADSRFKKSIEPYLTSDKSYEILPNHKAVILPLKALEAPNGMPFMIYTLKENSIYEKTKDNLFMIFVMGVVMILLSIPFAYYVSRPLSQGYNQLANERKELERRSRDMEREIKKAAREIARKDILLNHHSKLAAIGEIIGNISHQWRVPLTRIQLLMQNIKRRAKKLYGETPWIDSSIEQVKVQIEFMSATIDTFQNLYRKEEKGEFDVNESLRIVEKIAMPSITLKGIRFDIKSEEQLKLYGASNELGHVLLNLVANARYELVKRGVESPKIEINAYKKESLVVIEIEDNAGGFEEGVKKRIFEPHFSTKGDGGSGLGLYMSKMIIQNSFKGDIEPSSSSSGAKFTITLPLSTQSPSSLGLGYCLDQMLFLWI
eukprot:TRINITY_DN12836_c0_g1_i1.p1 TRINITY_DN12836_c0_g1~~TRINITY_DN12836_c0_g1_i1.p1  ORF type:complete len:493 (+),score=32.35 TRINITY_DN12836_c0_g1_i1:504-1982(+)